MIKFVRMLNNESDMLDKILEVGKLSRNVKEIRFDPMTMSKKNTNHPKKFVPHENKTEFYMLDHMAQHPARHVHPCN